MSAHGRPLPRAAVLWLTHMPSHSHWFFSCSRALLCSYHTPVAVSTGNKLHSAILWPPLEFLPPIQVLPGPLGCLPPSSFPSSSVSLLLALAVPAPFESPPVTISLREDCHLQCTFPSSHGLGTSYTALHGGINTSKKCPLVMTLQSCGSKQKLGTLMPLSLG